MVIAVKTAYGMYDRKDFMNVFSIFSFTRANGIARIKYVEITIMAKYMKYDLLFIFILLILIRIFNREKCGANK